MTGPRATAAVAVLGAYTVVAVSAGAAIESHGDPITILGLIFVTQVAAAVFRLAREEWRGAAAGFNLDSPIPLWPAAGYVPPEFWWLYHGEPMPDDDPQWYPAWSDDKGVMWQRQLTP